MNPSTPAAEAEAWAEFVWATAGVLAARDAEQVVHAVVRGAVSVPGVVGARFCLQRSGGPVELNAVSGVWEPSARRRGWPGRKGGGPRTLETNVVDGTGAVVGALSVRPDTVASDGDAGGASIEAAVAALAVHAGHALERIGLAERLDRVQAQLVTEQARARGLDATWNAAFDDAPIGMAVLSLSRDSLGHVLRVNDTLCRLTGHSAADLASLSVLDLVHSAERAALSSVLARAIGGRRTASTLALRLHTRGERGDVPVRVTTSLVVPVDGAPAEAICHVEDLSPRAHPMDAPGTGRDPHTGLLTGAGFAEAVTRTRDRARRTATTTAVLLCDLSLIDARSTALGQEQAVALRAELARQVQAVLRPDDAVGELDPTALGVVLAELSSADAQSVAARVHAAITRTLETLVPGRHDEADRPHHMGRAAGPGRPAEVAIAMLDPTDDDAGTEAVLDQALTALRGTASPQSRGASRSSYPAEPAGSTKIILWRRPEPGSEPPPPRTRVTLWTRPDS